MLCVCPLQIVSASYAAAAYLRSIGFNKKVSNRQWYDCINCVLYHPCITRNSGVNTAKAMQR